MDNASFTKIKKNIIQSTSSHFAKFNVWDSCLFGRVIPWIWYMQVK